MALSTLHVRIAAPADAPRAAAGPGTFLDGLDAGWGGLLTTMGVVLHVLGVLLPWLVAAGAVTAGVLAVRRRRRSPDPSAPAVEAG